MATRISLPQLQTKLGQRKALCLPATQQKRAAVALIIYPGQECPELLLIERTQRDGDPWSGNLAFPGGCVEQQDNSLLAAAMRETWEETAIALQAEHLVGQLDDITGAFLPVIVSCFVFYLPQLPALCPQDQEVADIFGVSLAHVLHPQNHVLAELPWQGQRRRVPGVRLPEPQRPLLWGITYRLLRQFCFYLDMPLPQIGHQGTGTTSPHAPELAAGQGA